MESVYESLEKRVLLSTYYVATTGNNASAGTSTGAAWKTLQYAADHVGPGDTVIVAPGNYVGFDIRHSGTANARIVFKAQSGAVINQVNTKTNRDGINVENASYITIDGFTLDGTNDPTTSRAGIRVVGDGFDTGVFSEAVIVQNNTCDQWGQWGIFTAFADDIIIQNNVCSRSKQQHGIYFSNSADRPTIRYNTCWGNAGCGIHVNADIETGNTDLPKVDGITTGALIDGNTCYGNGVAGGSAINCDGVQSSRIVNNLLYDNHASGIALFQIDGAQPSMNNTVANNTIIQAADGRWCIGISDGSTGNTIFNNILFNLHSFRGSISIDSASKPGTVSDYNLVDPRFSLDDSSLTFAQWKSTIGGDAHSATLTLAQMQALFTNYATKDFTLAAGSAAIDKGVSGLTNGTFKPAPGSDRLAHGRPAGNATDIGAYERGASPFATLVGGKLVIQGTGMKDVISLTLSGPTYTATLNGLAMNLPSSGVTSIEIYGNDGDDLITVGAGVMGIYINGGAGNDVIHGGDGSDTISAGAGKDVVYGGAGDDKVTGNQSNDSLYGEAGDDRIYGSDGNDLLDGGAGSDRLWGEAGYNTYYGQDGNDYFYCRNGFSDTIVAGAGVDHAQADTSGDKWSGLEYLLA
ncbi:MAG TPA: right-handed parallel beta-helix repeat-containing protein [Tepidisphaeraceae bacterium]